MRKIVIIIVCSLLPLALPATRHDISEQEFVDWLAALPQLATTAEQRAAVDSMAAHLSDNQRQLDTVLDWAAKYLLDSRSPLYAPAAYDSLFVMDSPGRHLIDFGYADTTGQRATLYTTALADTTVLFFYAADCDHCMALLSRWHERPETMPRALSRWPVVAVCLSTDKEQWQKSLALMPQAWRKVADSDGLIALRRYDLRQLPHIVVSSRDLISVPDTAATDL